jgi:hypothetical protein
MRCDSASVIVTIPRFASTFHSVVCQSFAIFNQKLSGAYCNFVFIVAFYKRLVNSRVAGVGILDALQAGAYPPGEL